MCESNASVSSKLSAEHLTADQPNVLFLVKCEDTPNPTILRIESCGFGKTQFFQAVSSSTPTLELISLSTSHLDFSPSEVPCLVPRVLTQHGYRTWNSGVMWTTLGLGYLVVGLAAAGFTLAVFPPQPGYRPPLKWLVLAVGSYIILWPFLALIGFGYTVGRWYNHTADESTPMVRPSQSNRPLYRTLYEETPN
jgi:hypothetical protein